MFTRWQSQHTLAVSVAYTTSHIINQMVAHIVGWNFSLPSAIKQQFNSLHIEFIEVGIVSCDWLSRLCPPVGLILSLYLSIYLCLSVKLLCWCCPIARCRAAAANRKQCLDSSLDLSTYLSISILVATALCPKQLRRKFHTTNAQCS